MQWFAGGSLCLLTKKVVGVDHIVHVSLWGGNSSETPFLTKLSSARQNCRETNHAADATCVSNSSTVQKGGNYHAGIVVVITFSNDAAMLSPASFSHSQKKLLWTQFIFVVHCNHEAWSALMPFMHHHLADDCCSTKMFSSLAHERVVC